jgi:hypothetical protein
MSNDKPNTISACKQIVSHLLSELAVKNKIIKKLEVQVSNYEKKLDLQLENLNESWFKDYKKIYEEHNNLEKEYHKLFTYCITIENELETFKEMSAVE